MGTSTDPKLNRPRLKLGRLQSNIPGFRRVSNAASSFEEGALKCIQTRLVDRQAEDRHRLARGMCADLDQGIDAIFAGRAEELPKENVIVHGRRVALASAHDEELTEAMILTELWDINLLTSQVNMQLEMDDAEGSLMWDFQRKALERKSKRLNELLANTKIPAMESEWLRSEIWGWVNTVTTTLAKANARLEMNRDIPDTSESEDEKEDTRAEDLSREPDFEPTLTRMSIDSTEPSMQEKRPSGLRRASISVFKNLKKWFGGSNKKEAGSKSGPSPTAAAPPAVFARRPSLAY